MRVRRLALVAVSAVLAGVSLAGCRSDPAVAAYVGDRKITVAEVDEIVRSVNAVADQRLAARKRAYDERMAAIEAGKGPDEYPAVPAEAMLPVVHTDPGEVLSLMVLGEVAGRIVADRRLPATEVPADVFAEAFGLPASDEFVRLWQDYWPGFTAVLDQSQRRPLTDDEAGRFYAALDETGQLPAGISYERFVAGVKGDVNLGAVFHAQGVLREAASGVTINPRYGSLVLPAMLQNSSTPVDVAFPGDGKVPVEEA